MKVTPTSIDALYVKFGNGEDDGAFSEDFFNGLLEDPSDDLEVESEPQVEPELTTTESDPKLEEVKPDPVVETTPAAVTDPVAQPVKVEPEVVVEKTEPVVTTPPADEPQQMNLDQIRGELEKQYALTDEQADLLTTDPQKGFPILAAQLHMQIMSQVLSVFERALPQQIQNITARKQEYEQVEGQFKQLYPDLDLSKKEVYDSVATAAQMVRTQFPQLAMDEKVKRVGLLAHSLLGNIPNVASPAAAVKQPNPKPAPVSPAPANRASTKPAAQQPNQWDQLLSEIQDED